ncbi:MAG TPA: TonB family protein [Dongiaceae bacterium]|nr:TonB family protein [Dongiaceae bacterium]
MSKPETWKSWEGRTVEGKFPLRQWLGGSDHSAVFLTESPDKPGQKAAIKLMAADGNGDDLLSHMRAAMALSHPNLIRIFEVGRSRIDNSQVVYAVMECADDDLSQILPERALEPSEVRDLLPPVLEALSYLHNKGLVHGRIKPSNVLAAGEQLKLSSDQVTPVGQQDGQRRRRDVYDAPETAAGIVSPAGDIWSVGVTLVAALTQNASAAEQSSPSKRELPETIPDRFRAIARACLELDPGRRASLKDIQAQLNGAGQLAPAPAREDEPKEAAVPPGKRRNVITVAVAVLVLLGIGLAWFYSHPSASPTKSAGTQSQPAPEPAPVVAPTRAPAQPAAKPRATGGEVVHQVLPDVPRSAQNTIRGTIKVVVKVEVDSSGKVSSASLKSPGSSRYFANEALNAARRWEFSAPEVQGAPVGSTWLLQFRFKRKSIQATPQRIKG